MTQPRCPNCHSDRGMEILDDVLGELPEPDRVQLVELLERFIVALDDHVAAEATEPRR